MLRFSLLEDTSGFLPVLEKQIDANAEATKNKASPLTPASEVFARRDGKLLFFKTPFYRHHSNIVGQDKLPLISLGDTRYLTVRLFYRPDGGQGRTYWNLLWTDEAGAVINSMENYCPSSEHLALMAA